MSEDDNGFDIQGPLPFSAEALIVYAEGRLAAPPDGVDLVAFLPAVEIELSVTVIVIERHSVRITVISQNGQDAAHFLFQDLDALLL